ncbi:MAG: HzsA-related protein, partial [Planctomycetota bacterium]
WNPALANDGRILYTRWDYIDRFNGHFFSLWSTNTDGTNPQLVYGNFTVRPQAVLEARPIPNSRKLIFTASAHHSITGGSLVLLDRTRGIEDSDPLVRLTPEVAFPETEAWADMYYANPYPLSEDHYLVCWSDRRLPPHCRVDDSKDNPINATGLYLYDAFGNLNLLYRDPNISAAYPIPVRPRHVPPKTQPHMNSPNLGVSKEDPGKFVLGTVPVERDGSAHFRVPSGIPVFFQALDSNGLAIQTMRTLTYVQPGQTLACIGCHEPRNAAPAAETRAAAAQREPSRLTVGPSGSWPLRFDRLVQPVLDTLCISCHHADSLNQEAARFDLTAANSYSNLLLFDDKDLQDLAFEKDNSIIGQCPARKSKLLTMLTDGEGHEGVRLDADSFNRLVIWMDLYAQRQGSFSEDQEEALRKLRRQVASLLAE